MAAALARLPGGFFPHQLFFSLLALQYGSVDSQTNSQTNVVVTQHPLFDNLLQGETLELKCSVNQNNYYFFWYHQVPGQTLGTFRTFEKELQEPAAELKGRLSGERKDEDCYLNLTELQPSDSGLYLCAASDTVILAGTDTVCPSSRAAGSGFGCPASAGSWPSLDGTWCKAAPPSVWGSRIGEGTKREPLWRDRPRREDFARASREAAAPCYQAYFAKWGTQVLVKDPECDHDQLSSPSALLLGPACHKKSATLVCLAQDFSYRWPLDVRWKRDGQEVPHLSVATEEAKKQGKCSFGIASRLSVAAEEWKQGYTYSCNVSQGHITANAEITSKRSQQSFSGTENSLRVGQLIFLLLAVKSFAYGIVLGIYTVCRKTDL